MTAPKVTPYAPIDPDLSPDALRLLARRYQVERDVARAGERAATAMAADVAARMNEALEAYRVEVEAAMRAAFDGAVRAVLTAEQAREMRQECFENVDIDTMPDRTINALCDAIDALLLRVAGPVTAEQASMAAAFDACTATYPDGGPCVALAVDHGEDARCALHGGARAESCANGVDRP